MSKSIKNIIVAGGLLVVLTLIANLIYTVKSQYTIPPADPASRECLMEIHRNIMKYYVENGKFPESLDELYQKGFLPPQYFDIVFEGKVSYIYGKDSFFLYSNVDTTINIVGFKTPFTPKKASSKK
ncbi:hypothetical protein J7J62_03015 [bacterium]|nr:hypothetical protein [bacterium]